MKYNSTTRIHSTRTIMGCAYRVDYGQSEAVVYGDDRQLNSRREITWKYK